ncbi:hypothetical protein GCM10017044_17600 [Kordiimonas sediminis]|uniref:PAS domain-containing protein n=1 Tax=Kordiimonas sediminis TaxID=1735581 RepID=A0A919E7X6_9PROT|nr:PAS domain-containing protein [Kordiimonas sediminis]GHF23539.1 hypothetical protein GCM10017044_17600 [Kordiimonas sediminis]
MELSGPLSEMMEYWRALPRQTGSVIPNRLAFHPKHFTHIMPRLSLLKRVDDDQLMFGVVATSVEELWAHPVTGINAYDLAAPKMQQNLSRFCDAILDQPSGAFVKETVANEHGQLNQVNSLYLPMNDKDGIPNYILGCTLAEKPGNKVPLSDRFVLDHNKIRGIKFLDIGCGTPAVDFVLDNTPNTLTHTPRPNWWQRLIPTSSTRPSGPRRH